MDKSTMWSLAAKNGLILSLITIIVELLSLAFTFPGWASIVITIVKLGLIIFLLYKFMKSYSESCEGVVTYGQSFTYGFILCLCSTVVCTLFSFIDYTWINPDVTDMMLEQAELAMANTPQLSGMDPDKFAAMMPKMTILALFLKYIFFGVLIPLIIAAYTKKESVFTSTEEE